MSTWGTRRIYDIAQALTHVYYRLKYGTLVKRMRYVDIDTGADPGFIIIQIDGLSYPHLLEALGAGAMPYLARALDEGSLSLSSWKCGLPSATPAIQAAIMFGSREDIPGFRWYDKELGVSIVAKRPAQMQALQERLKGEMTGLLAGGSSYVNMFDADADLALFTLSALHPHRFIESVKGFGMLLVFLLSPFRVVRVLVLTVVGYLRALFRRLLAVFRPTVYKPYDVFSPLLASAVDALFTEAQTFGVMLDIYRRAPAIYANYNHYDEITHLMGPTHADSFQALRAVDRRIQQIDRMRTRYQARPYDLYILSDHGNTPSVPFSWEVGRSLGRFILQQLGEQLSLDEVFSQAGYKLAKTRYLLEDLRAVSQRLPTGLSRVLKAMWRYMDRRIPTDRDLEPYDLERREDVVVRASGPLAHVYFNVTRRALDLIEVAVLYPRLLDQLLDTEAIGLVIGRVGDHVVALGPDGGATTISASARRVVGIDPVAVFGDPEWVSGEIRRVVRFPHAGDLVLLGRMDPGGRTVTFEEQTATHGGIGGPQGEPFIALPPGVELPPMSGPEDLHRLFWHRYRE